MGKLIFSVLILFGSLASAKPSVIVSILPEKTFVNKIAKERVDVTLMVAPGSSPHSYEPKSSQMVALSKADIYFSIGVEFEDVWLDKFTSQNPHLRFVNISDGVAKIVMGGQHQHEDDKHNAEKHQHDGLDPHTWTSPENVAIMAHAIYKALVEIDPADEPFFKKNLDDFIKEIKNTDAQIKKLLKEVEPKSKFMVFHPSWGYFANAYGLTQVSVEVEGKSPKPKEIIRIIEEAKEEKVKVIFTQPEFSDKSARIIAKEAKVEVKKISPLSAEWSQNLINMAEAIAEK